MIYISVVALVIGLGATMVLVDDMNPGWWLPAVLGILFIGGAAYYEKNTPYIETRNEIITTSDYSTYELPIESTSLGLVRIIRLEAAWPLTVEKEVIKYSFIDFVD